MRSFDLFEAAAGGFLASIVLALVGCVVALAGVSYEINVYDAEGSGMSSAGLGWYTNYVSTFLSNFWWAVWLGVGIELALLAAIRLNRYDVAREPLRSLAIIETALLTTAVFDNLLDKYILRISLPGFTAALAGFFLMAIAFYVQIIYLSLDLTPWMPCMRGRAPPTSHTPLHESDEQVSEE